MTKERKDTAIFVAYDDDTPFDPVAPEKSLLVAVLRSAMSDLRLSGEIRRQAREFFLCADKDYVFSFWAICNMLEIDPLRILRKVGLEDEFDRRRVKSIVEQALHRL